MSEYKDPFGVLARLGEDKGLNFNRISEVLVMDHDQKDEVPMSFASLREWETCIDLLPDLGNLTAFHSRRHKVTPR
ncbi:hypothetical protein K435DRAFT_880772 [Dendrothele bispora CBS 962.96]|uniref:Uncharacterized protein n=1 Tax=Dendrothele bispora (strain CBS 962.96) TaxID=1314807 RepID=A0A4S8KJ51_DENBC|nr:hypothetical protein K435DRAFT_880772 [Dendrothele bispora CBS 962.96]